jgi:tartrate dehydratase beta subunit/fumarate hydratase class I family protein
LAIGICYEEQKNLEGIRQEEHVVLSGVLYVERDVVQRAIEVFMEEGARNGADSGQNIVTCGMDR